MRRRSFLHGAAALGLLAGQAEAQTYVRAFASYALPPYTATWLAAVIANGATASATTVSALAALELGLLHCGLIPSIAYLNPRCGDSLTAAKIPLIFTSGPGFDIVSGSFSSWNEANGLKGTTGIANTGVAANVAVSATATTLGVYLPVNSPASSFYMYGDATATWGLTVCFGGQYIIFDNYFGAGTGRIQTDSPLIYDGANDAGLICGSRDGTSTGSITRNGSIRSITAGAANGSVPSATIKLYTAQGQSCGDFIATGLNQDQTAMMTWLLHQFNTALGRPAVAVGLF